MQGILQVEGRWAFSSSIAVLQPCRGETCPCRSYLSTTQPPCDTETAVSSGLLGSPLLGTTIRFAADWCHAWSLLGQWSGLVTFPVPTTGQWPRHGHLRGILDGFQGRQPNFHKCARPAYEQGALPTLSLLPGEVVIEVLPVFSVQRLHGFRQVVQHVSKHVAFGIN